MKDLAKRAKKTWTSTAKTTKIKKQIVKKKQSRDERILEIEINNKKWIKVNTNIWKWSPSKYKPKYVKEMLEYFENHVKWWYYEEYITEEFVWKNWVMRERINTRPKAPPRFEWFAMKIWVDVRTLRNWATDRNEGKLLYPSFFLSYKRCLSIQLRMLKDLGITWQYNSSIAKLLLSAEHSIFDLREDQQSTSDWKKKQELNEKDLMEELGEFFANWKK